MHHLYGFPEDTIENQLVSLRKAPQAFMKVRTGTASVGVFAQESANLFENTDHLRGGDFIMLGEIREDSQQIVASAWMEAELHALPNLAA
jgi:hypothetical protein